jgi:hypothetical protein
MGRVCEYEPDGMIDERTIRDFTDSERAYLAIFEKLRDTVDAIPTSLIEAAEQRYVASGPVGYEEAMIANIQAIECQTPPKDAAEFLTTFDAGLRPAGLVLPTRRLPRYGAPIITRLRSCGLSRKVQICRALTRAR